RFPFDPFRSAPPPGTTRFMIDSGATRAIAKDTVEHARDAVQEGLVELSDRIKDASVVPRHARARRRVAMRRIVFLCVVALVGAGVGAWIVAAQRRNRVSEIAPDAFGDAVEEERVASILQPAAR